MRSTDGNLSVDASFPQTASQPLYVDGTANRKKGLGQRMVAFFKRTAGKAQSQEKQQQEVQENSFSANGLLLSREGNVLAPNERAPLIPCVHNEKNTRAPSLSLHRNEETDNPIDKKTRTDDCDAWGTPSSRQSALTMFLSERVAEPLTGNDPWRFAIVLSYSALTISNSLQATTFSPIPHEVCRFFDTTMLEVNLLSSIYLIMYVLAVVMGCKAFESVGLQRSLAFAACLNAIGAAVKLIAFYVYPRPPLLFVSQCINAFSQVFIIAHPPTIASLWFNDSHRTTANATMTATQNLGFAIGVVMPTLIVHSWSDHAALYLSFERLFWTHFGTTVVSLVMIMFLFPKRPRVAASAMAAEAIQHDLRRSQGVHLRTHRRGIEKNLRHQRQQRKQQQRQQQQEKRKMEEKQKQSKNIVQGPSAATSSPFLDHGHDGMVQDCDSVVAEAEAVAIAVPPSRLRASSVMLRNNNSESTHASDNNKNAHYTRIIVQHQASYTPCEASLNNDAVRDPVPINSSLVDRDADLNFAEDIEGTRRSDMTEEERVRRSLFVAVATAIGSESMEGHTHEHEGQPPPHELDEIIFSLEAKLQRIREAELAHPSINVFQMVRGALHVLSESRSFTLLTISNMLILGSVWSLAMVLPQVVTPLGFSESLAGWIGFVNLLVGGLAAPVLAPLIVGKERNFKRALLICAVILVIDMFTMLTLIAVIQKGFALQLIVFIGWGGIGGVTQTVMLPLLFEFGAELTYPASQATTATVTLWAVYAASFLMTQVSSFVLGGKPTIREAMISWGITSGFALLGAITLVAVHPHRFREEYDARRLALQISAAEREESQNEGEPTAQTIK